MEINYKFDIGHALVADAVFLEIDRAVIIMKNTMNKRYIAKKHHILI